MEKLGLTYRLANADEYRCQQKIGASIVCVNDACERAVKLAGDKNKEGP